jgi:hypothetical protein
MANDNNVSVTNQTNTAAAILDAYDPSAQPGEPQANQIYALPMSLRQTLTGAQTIGANANASVVLDPARIIYDLVFARPADLFPLQNSSVMQNVISGAYPPVNIDATSPDQLTLALTFYINLLTYPTSNIAVQYNAAVSGAANNGDSDSAIESAVAAFFQSTTNYKTLTLNSVVTVQTYARSFAYVWAGFTQGFASFSNSIKYYLYSPGTAAAGSNEATPTYQGALSMTKSSSPPNPADPTDRTGAYQIVYTDPNGKTTGMLFSGGQFVSDNSDFPSIALRGTFILKSSLTNQATDNVIVPIVNGAVNGVQVMGTTTQQSTSGGETSDFWSFFHPKTFGEYLTLITTAFGLVMGLEWIGAKAKGVVDWFRSRNKPPEQSEISKMREEMNKLGDELKAKQQEILDKLGNKDAKVPAEEEMPAEQKAVQEDVVDANNVARGEAQLDVLQEQGAQLEIVAEYGVNPQVEQIAEDIRINAQNIEAAMPPEGEGGQPLQDAVDNGAKGIAEIQPKLVEQIENVQQDLNADDAADIKASQEAQGEAQEVDENAEKAAEDAGNREGGEGEDPIEVDV